MSLLVHYFVIFSIVIAAITANPFGLGAIGADDSPTDDLDLTIGSQNYSKGQVISALVNGLLEVGIENGLIGGDLFMCPEADGLYPDPLDCTYYFNCTNHISNHTKCPEKLAFDNNTNACIEQDKVPLCHEVSLDSDYKCPFEGLHLYPKDCGKYYICIKEKAFVTKCPDDTNFDNALRLCIPKTQALCLPEKSVGNKTTIVAQE